MRWDGMGEDGTGGHRLGQYMTGWYRIVKDNV